MNLKNNGEQSLTNEQKVNEFLQKVDDWIEDRNIDLAEKNEEVAEIMSMKSDDIRSLSQEKALSFSFVLFSHAEYLQTLHNKEKTVVEFCSDSIWFIVADKMDNYGGQYAKWEMRYYSAIKENPLAAELNRLKLTAEARINRLSGKIDAVKKMASVLHDIGKKRGY
jgi:hypothetical protein|tara:strand:- start:18383 stop:18880 length:498 start_codon:yes stop_codon:yes gene_type:complete